MLRQQLFEGSRKPCKALFSNPNNHISVMFLNKPAGGIWTSTYINKRHGSEWIQWKLHADFNVPRNFNVPRRGWKYFLLTPKKESRILVIDSCQEYQEIFEKYKYYPFDKLKIPVLDFEKLSKEYDGINLTTQGLMDIRYSWVDIINLSSWDCESTIWLNWSFEDNIESFDNVKFNKRKRWKT